MEQQQVFARSGILGGRYQDLFWLLVLGALWGSSYLFIKVTVSEVPALTLVAGRLLISSLTMWIIVFASRQAIPRGRSLWVAFAVMGLLSSAIPWALISWGEQYISSGLAGLLQATMPIFTVILASLLSTEERLTPLNILGVAVGFVGVGILMLPDLRQGIGGNLLGQLAIILSSVSYGAGAVFARIRLRGQPAIVSTTGQFTTGLLFILPLALLIDRPYHLTPSLPAIGSWLALAILGTVFAYIIYYYLIRRTTATLVSTVTYIIPVNALLLGALVLGEPLSLTMVGGLVLILLGVLLVRT